ncbi:molybdenum ABC transporter molybdate-binding protein [Povalibacter uvarum]|uniref:Molybdenum ABC transporter molybdate-binding protein n=1 Tax=Povalibacter uvarum TaxID=732238 RepID=A0A841HJD7_9GAMM|nr:molybdate ABC transporter substrate-binding protein [Povalibacter uvarum]MBB6092145.1 molybdenum ABC transporter molybdate-binding protein [Povalibacter uvarum]
MTFRSRLMWLAVLILGLTLRPTFAAEQAREPLLVFAAASLTDSLQKISDAYTQSTGVPVKLSFAASSALAKQIESGARVDVFVSADQEWMDYLDSRGFIKAGSRSDLLGNRLVLIAPGDSSAAIKLVPGAPIIAVLGERGRLAVGDPDSVPAGKYAKAALSSLGVWGALEPRLARAENVRVALSYVARGEAPLGIVYATDAAAESKVRLVDVFPENTHAPITYPIGLTKSAGASAGDYVKFLRSDAASQVFRKAGFAVLASREAMTSGCTGFAFDVAKELAVLKGQPIPLAAAASTDKMPTAGSGKAYSLLLVDQSAAKFVVAPEKITVADGSYGGLLNLSPTTGTLRVTLSEAAWVDVLSGSNAVKSVRHTGSHNCAPLRKSVEFNVAPGAPLTLQISGSTSRTLLLAITEQRE